MKREIDLIEIDADLGIVLKDLSRLIPELIDKYGEDSLISFDAGYNNVVARIIPSKSLEYFAE